MRQFNRPILFYPGYGESRKLLEPAVEALEDCVHRRVFVPALYPNTGERAGKAAPSRTLAQLGLSQFRSEYGEIELDLFGHSYGAMMIDQTLAELGKDDQRRVALAAPAGIGRHDIGLPLRFTSDLAGTYLSQPAMRGFTREQAWNILRRPRASAEQAHELVRAGGLDNVMALGDRALVMAFSEDKVFPKIASFLEKSEVRVVTLPIEAGHYAPMTHPEVVAEVAAAHLNAES